MFIPYIQGRSRTCTTPCTIGSNWGFLATTNVKPNTKQMSPRSLQIMQHFMCVFLHDQNAVDVGQVTLTTHGHFDYKKNPNTTPTIWTSHASTKMALVLKSPQSICGAYSTSFPQCILSHSFPVCMHRHYTWVIPAQLKQMGMGMVGGVYKVPLWVGWTCTSLWVWAEITHLPTYVLLSPVFTNKHNYDNSVNYKPVGHFQDEGALLLHSVALVCLPVGVAIWIPAWVI